MTTLNKDIQDKLQNLNVFEKLIGVNLVVFFVGLIIKVVFTIGSALVGWNCQVTLWTLF